MTPDELAKHGLRVKARERRDMDIVWQMNADSFHEARICAALEPIAPADVAQAALVKALRWIEKRRPHDILPDGTIGENYHEHGRAAYDMWSCASAALRVIAGEAP